MTGYTVALTVALAEEATIDQAEQVLEALAENAGALAVGRELTITLSLAASSIGDAVRGATALARRACRKAHLTVVEIPYAQAWTDEHFERELARPAFPELAGLSEVAGLVGVSRQRIAELRRRPDFPAPVAQLAAGPVWRTADLSRFCAEWERKPGRPRTSDGQDAVAALRDARRGIRSGNTSAKHMIEDGRRR